MIVFGATLNLLSNAIFLVIKFDPKSDAIQEQELIWGIMELAGKPNLSDYFPMIKPFDLQGTRRTIKVSCDRLHRLIDELIDKRLERRTSRSPRCNDFLAVLLNLNIEQGHEEFNCANVEILLTVIITKLCICQNTTSLEVINK